MVRSRSLGKFHSCLNAESFTPERMCARENSGSRYLILCLQSPLHTYLVWATVYRPTIRTSSSSRELGDFAWTRIRYGIIRICSKFRLKGSRHSIFLRVDRSTGASCYFSFVRSAVCACSFRHTKLCPQIVENLRCCNQFRSGHGSQHS